MRRTDLRFSEELRADLAARLVAFDCRRLPAAGRQRAAVAIALVPDDDGQAAVILTRRAQGLRRHSGQYALPGGRVDPGETPEGAGLRELREEVGLELPPSGVLGRLDDFATRSGFLITPLVVWAGEGELTPDPREVAAVFRVPLADCGRPRALVETHVFAGEAIPALALESVGAQVFPPTAAILHQAAELAVHGRHTPVADFPQPAFAWR